MRRELNLTGGKMLTCHLYEKPESVILVVTADILQFVDFGSSAGR